MTQDVTGQRYFYTDQSGVIRAEPDRASHFDRQPNQLNGAEDRSTGGGSETIPPPFFI